MPVNYNTIIVFDFETGGLDISTLEPLSIAAVALDPRTLQEKDRFESLMRPIDPLNVSARAMEINKLDIEVLKKAPEQGLVWAEFVRFCAKHNPKKGVTTAPIPAGKNIRRFDLPICERLCRTYGNVDKKGEPNIFNRLELYDINDFVRMWFESDPELKNNSMDSLREYFGMSKTGAHSAMTDALQEADLIVRFLKLHRSLKTKKNRKGEPMIQFAGSCGVNS